MTQHNRMLGEEWLETLYKGGKSPHTIAAYRRALAHFLHWHEIAYAGLTFDLASILPRDIRDWKARQQRVEKASPASINQRLVALNQLFDWAQQQGLVRSNPAQHIAALRLDRLKPHALKASALRRLLRAAQVEARDYAMIELLVGTGVRVSKLLSLTC
jgi:integrase/recombinase XerD